MEPYKKSSMLNCVDSMLMAFLLSGYCSKLQRHLNPNSNFHVLDLINTWDKHTDTLPYPCNCCPNAILQHRVQQYTMYWVFIYSIRMQN